MLKMKPRVKDKEGNLTTYGVYLDCRAEIKKKFRELPVGVTRRKDITWREFSLIVRLYWKFTFERLLDRGQAKLRHNFGTLRIAKTLCINYYPHKFYHVRDENGKVIGTERRLIDVEKYNGYYFFIWYDSNKYKRYKIFPVHKIRKAYMERVESGEDYIDITR